MVVLDTDHVTLLHHEASAESTKLRDRLRALPTAEVATAIVTFEEQVRGWLAAISRASRPHQLLMPYARLARLLVNYRFLNVLEFATPAAELLADLNAQRLRVGSMDLRIAAITLAHDATLLTRNKRDFAKIPGLRIEDWTA